MKKLSTLLLALLFTAVAFGQPTDAQRAASNALIRSHTDGQNTKTFIAGVFDQYNQGKVSRTEALSTAGTNTYTVSADASITDFTKSFQLFLRFPNANSGMSTLNVNGLGAKNLKSNAGAALTTGDIVAASYHWVVYDVAAGYFKLAESAGGSGGGGTWGSITGTLSDQTDLQSAIDAKGVVTGGGTGRTTLTAYAPLFGGTTSTGAIQSGTVGTAGQVLTSNGAGALPTFQAAGGGGGWATSGTTTTLTGSPRIVGSKVIFKNGANFEPIDGAGVEIQDSTYNANGAVLDFYSPRAIVANDRIYELHGYSRNSSAVKKQMTAIYSEMVDNTASDEKGRLLMNLTAGGALLEFFRSEAITGLAPGQSKVSLKLANTFWTNDNTGELRLGPLYSTVPGYFTYGKSLNDRLSGGLLNTSNGNLSYAEWDVGNTIDGTRTNSISMTSFSAGWTPVAAYAAKSGALEAGDSMTGGLEIIASHSTGGDIKFYAGGNASADLSLTLNDDGTSVFAGSLTVGATNAIVGTTTNNNATAGNMGETGASLLASGSATSLTTAIAKNITSVSLTAGDYIVWGNVNFTETTSTVTGRSAGITVTSATVPTDGTESYCGVQSTLTSETNTISLTPKRISLASTTTVYLVGFATFSAGTCAGFGSLNWQRIR